ncbi:LysM domain receptor-like kinase 3 [Camellia lanceoleosa]|uniref:LysM domain receptor-like kinase 3 n=1 Tax=Camellia lanceoleosa TaxID=1840588 RepID=A0ACC0HG57_9ERIC|nr:LysM domain receptor-like kinase 3 [Camellia lanceoleosa]
MFPYKLGLFAIIISIFFCARVESTCSKGCDLALASYYVWPESNLTFIQEVMSDPISDILSYNPKIPNQDSVQSDIRINIPFTCDCINGDFFAHVFKYRMRVADTYEKVAGTYYANLTTTEWVQHFNSYAPNRIPDGVQINVTVNCSCGNSSVSKDYGLFMTYPLRPGESLDSVATDTNLTTAVLKSYNPDANFSAGSGLVFIPAKAGLSVGVIAGISIAGVAGALLLAVGVYVGFYRKKKVKDKLLSSRSDDQSLQVSRDPGSALEKAKDSTGVGSSPGLHTGLTVDKSVEFSYEELANATNDFSIAYKIGEGGFGAVYYAELRGEKAAIKKMDMQASKEFLAELKVLTHVHHLNLVRLIGYCVEGSLFLVYEFIENGNLSEHLRGGRDPLPWSTRVQIALDSARGLEYIHEHTVPVYIHRDIKSANILIDKNYRGKVADFGLTKLTEVGSTSLPTRLVGTFGYMPPEYAQYGDVSPKVDVYAFGVVLYELISAKEAIVKASESMPESRGLIGLFDEVLTQPDPGVDLPKLVDPRLGDNYPLDSVRKMAQLAKACTQENPQLRPSMRSIVVALMTLSSATEDWDIGAFYENQTLVNQMSGR